MERQFIGGADFLHGGATVRVAVIQFSMAVLCNRSLFLKNTVFAILALKKPCKIGVSNHLLRNNTRHFQSDKPEVVLFKHGCLLLLLYFLILLR